MTYVLCGLACIIILALGAYNDAQTWGNDSFDARKAIEREEQ